MTILTNEHPSFYCQVIQFWTLIIQSNEFLQSANNFEMILTSLNAYCTFIFWIRCKRNYMPLASSLTGQRIAPQTSRADSDVSNHCTNCCSAKSYQFAIFSTLHAALFWCFSFFFLLFHFIGQLWMWNDELSIKVDDAGYTSDCPTQYVWSKKTISSPHQKVWRNVFFSKINPSR